MATAKRELTDPQVQGPQRGHEPGSNGSPTELTVPVQGHTNEVINLTESEVTEQDVETGRVGAQQIHRVLVPIEAAELLRISLPQLYHLTSQQKIPFTKVGGVLRFDRDRLLEFIANGASADGRAPKAAGVRKAAPRGSSASANTPTEREERRFRFATQPRTRGGEEK